MCSFNDANGIPLSGNIKLLKKLLRDELKFNGVVVSDWESIKEMIEHGFALNEYDASLKAFLATVDIDMNSGFYHSNLKNIIQEKPELKEYLNESVSRILKLKENLNLFKNHHIDHNLSKKVFRNKRYINITRKAAQESIVLLKNENKILPIQNNNIKIGLIGPFIDDKVNPLGCWACKGESKNVVSILEGIKNKIKEKDLNIELLYEKGTNVLSFISDGIKNAINIAKKCDVLFVALGESRNMSGENHNRTNIDIPFPQKKLLKELYKVNKNIVLILLNGRPLTLEWEAKNVPTILEAWHLGDESGNAIADVIFGDYNPSGKLTMTFPRKIGQIPIYYNKKKFGRPYVNNYLDCDNTPLFPFGYGLSYSNFNYKKLSSNKKSFTQNEKIEITITIKNESSIAGYEIIQLYIEDITASVKRPIKELKKFKKVFFEPFEEKEITFILEKKDFMFLNSDYEYIFESGLFNIFVGKNSEEYLNMEIEIN